MFVLNNLQYNVYIFNTISSILFFLPKYFKILAIIYLMTILHKNYDYYFMFILLEQSFCIQAISFLENLELRNLL